ncbi:unknow [Vibrio campbellii]|nr:unknow [Vibrio campbellii]
MAQSSVTQGILLAKGEMFVVTGGVQCLIEVPLAACSKRNHSMNGKEWLS